MSSRSMTATGRAAPAGDAGIRLATETVRSADIAPVEAVMLVAAIIRAAARRSHP